MSLLVLLANADTKIKHLHLIIITQINQDMGQECLVAGSKVVRCYLMYAYEECGALLSWLMTCES
jgi:hypothetical protein